MQTRKSDLISNVKDVDANGRKVDIYLAHFNTIDSDNEKFLNGAFRKSIADHGPEGSGRIKHLLQHDIMSPIGRFLELYEDEVGLRAISEVVNTQKGTDTLKLYEAGIFNEHSVGFSEVKGKFEFNSEGVGVWSEVKLWEGSTVTWGANENTPFRGFKSLDIEGAKDMIVKFSKAIADGTFTDETFGLLQIGLDNLVDTLKNLEDVEADQKPITSTNDIEVAEVYKSFYKIFSS